MGIQMEFLSDKVIILFSNCYDRLISDVNNYYCNLIYCYFDRSGIGGGMGAEWERLAI